MSEDNCAKCGRSHSIRCEYAAYEYVTRTIKHELLYIIGIPASEAIDLDSCIGDLMDIVEKAYQAGKQMCKIGLKEESK